MCEITILKTDRFSTLEFVEIAMELYRSQRSALGIVAVYDQDGKFTYETYRSTEPDEQEVSGFIANNNSAIRFVFHGRLATHGERDNRGTHPIEIDCPECDIQYVLHNGIVGNQPDLRERLEQEGHEFTTEVDSELIAHGFGQVPSSIEDPQEGVDASLCGEPASILLGEERFYVETRAYSRYKLVDGIELFQSHRWWANHEATGDYASMLVTPGSSAPTSDNETEAPA